MANSDTRRGFVPAYHKLGGEITSIKHTSNGEIFKGDAVKLEADGDVAAATPGDRLYGVAVNYVSAADKDVYVVRDPYVVFRVQSDNNTTQPAETDYGRFADIATEHAGDSTTQLSGMELDGGTITAGSAQLRIEQKDASILVPVPDNAAGANSELYVSLFEQHDGIVSAAATVDTTPGV